VFSNSDIAAKMTDYQTREHERFIASLVANNTEQADNTACLAIAIAAVKAVHLYDAIEAAGRILEMEQSN